MTRIMLIGAFPPPVGGTSVSLRSLEEFLRARGVFVCNVDCAVRGLPKWRVLRASLVNAWRNASNCDVLTLHLSDRGTVTAGPLFWALAQLRRRPLVFRQFGGEFHRTFRGLGGLRRWLLRHTVLSADLVMFQTLEQVSELAVYCRSRPIWFPTARLRSSAVYEGRYASGGSMSLECLYIGHVRRLKGVLEAALAAASVPGTRLNVYGPLIDVSEDELRRAGATYHGIVQPSDVSNLMARHDLLVFPTRYPGEGYPGVLVEAALVGLPVLATRWQALPEMFPGDEILWLDDSSVESIARKLAEVRSRAASLRAASAKIRMRGDLFDADAVFERFYDACTKVARVKRHA